MSDWIERAVHEAELSRTAIEDKRQRDAAAKEIYQLQHQMFWKQFLNEIRTSAEKFNSLVGTADRLTLLDPEPGALALRCDHPTWGGQFVARLRPNEQSAEVTVLAGRTITNIDCPIGVEDSASSKRLAFRADNGELHQPPRAAEMLLDGFFRYTLGLLTEAEKPDALKQRIGFAVTKA